MTPATSYLFVTQVTLQIPAFTARDTGRLVPPRQHPAFVTGDSGITPATREQIRQHAARQADVWWGQQPMTYRLTHFTFDLERLVGTSLATLTISPDLRTMSWGYSKSLIHLDGNHIGSWETNRIDGDNEQHRLWRHEALVRQGADPTAIHPPVLEGATS